MRMIRTCYILPGIDAEDVCMTGTALKWTLEAFLEWEREQPEKYEFDGSAPQLMTGGNEPHDTIGNNVRAFLTTALRDSGCRLQGPDLKILTGAGTSRYPDALINCAPKGRGDVAVNPVVVVEVLSRRKSEDRKKKLAEYGSTPAIQQYVIIFQDEAKVESYERGGDGHLALRETYTSMNESVMFRGIPMSLSEIYYDVDFGA
jgi:Uma2 family endonuclease